MACGNMGGGGWNGSMHMEIRGSTAQVCVRPCCEGYCTCWQPVGTTDDLRECMAADREQEGGGIMRHHGKG
jgi:hypothetical protein